MFKMALIVGCAISCLRAQAVVSATNAAANVGSAVSVAVQITGATNLYAYQFDFAFDPTKLTVNSISEGTFLNSGRTTIFLPGTVDNVGGHVSFVADTLVGPVVGASGAGKLAAINFTAIGAGTSAVSLSNVVLLDSALNTLPVSTSNGTVTVTGTAGSVPTISSLGLAVLAVALLGTGLLVIRQHRAC